MPNNEFGDFQTPLPLARQVLEVLGGGREWGRVLEPTCGTGNFLLAATEAFPRAEVVGIEVQPDYAARSRTVCEVLQRNIFDLDLARDLAWKRDDAPILVVGNPPWVTNAQLAVLGSANRPVRANIRNLRGIDAMTGASNFDIAEYIWLKLIAELLEQEPVVAMLCKTQVARNVLSFCADNRWPVKRSAVHHIDAKRWFGAMVDACLFTVEVARHAENYTCEVYPSLDAPAPDRRMGVVEGRLVADVDAYERSRHADGTCPLEWRQGVKHDASRVMELRQEGGDEANGPVTKDGEPVDVEEDYLFPLLKSTDVFRGRVASLSKWMVVPQRRLSDDTAALATTAPRLWSYLRRNAAALDGRKSSIYRGRPRFCVFGLGDYTFAPYKVAISGLHKSLEFRAVGPLAGRPVVFDDTCYFLSFADGVACAVVSALLSSAGARELLSAMVFTDAKRPVTKRLLQRIDLAALLRGSDPEALADAALTQSATLGLRPTREDVRRGIAALRDAWTGPAPDAPRPAPAPAADGLFRSRR
ncbi:SAM-dependent methyltransferase [Streptomyces sp. B1866]|uniref:SAM-dependent methyltransferase n=1 Tax=Streptomyces sp. B1866 TaxID=3075431 RepID=UPI00288FA39C|nr:SAM-dependent methyltransferase [Streptomyces sp. B1866]MDT3396410.1 SAM-dependent methyltransferase [Streptomyces sp. B1866]